MPPLCGDIGLAVLSALMSPVSAEPSVKEASSLYCAVSDEQFPIGVLQQSSEYLDPFHVLDEINTFAPALHSRDRLPPPRILND